MRCGRRLLGHQWRSIDPAMDELQRELAALVERPESDFGDVCEAIGAPAPSPWTPAESRPHLTESWFCCAEPTAAQRSVVGEQLPQRDIEAVELP